MDSGSARRASAAGHEGPRFVGPDERRRHRSPR